MELKKKLQQKLKEELEVISKAPLADSQAYEAYFNLHGFFKILNQMKKEANSHGNV